MQINLTPDPTLLVIIAIFFANYWIVRKFFIQPINAILTGRESEVKGAEKLYEQSLARFNEAAAGMESRLHTARREATAVRESLRNEAAQHRSEVVAKTRGEADAIVASADTALKGDVTTARTRIEQEAESLARLAAERILGRAL